jgi:hypothetical protein
MPSANHPTTITNINRTYCVDTVTLSTHTISTNIRGQVLFYPFLQKRPKDNKYFIVSPTLPLLSPFSWLFWMKPSPFKRAQMHLGPFLYRLCLLHPEDFSSLWRQIHSPKKVGMQYKMVPSYKILGVLKAVLKITHTSSVSPRISTWKLTSSCKASFGFLLSRPPLLLACCVTLTRSLPSLSLGDYDHCPDCL